VTDSIDVIAILTSHNRRAQTLACLQAFFAQQIDDAELHAVLVDDGSSDGTADAVAAEFARCTVLHGDGSLYWARGMAMAEAEALRAKPDYLLWLNDDVVLSPTAVPALLHIAGDVTGPVVVAGALVDPVTGVDSYGAVRRVDWHPMRYALVPPNGSVQDGDTCNGNVLLVPAETLHVIGGIDGGFEHGYADFDYGLRVRKAGGRVVLSPTPVGTCSENTSFAARAQAAGTLRERLRVLGDVKGRPWRSEVRYLRRHASVWWPAIFAVPYLKAAASVGRGRSVLASTGGVVMLEGAAADYRIPFYQELVGSLAPAHFYLNAEIASPDVVGAVTSAGGAFGKLASLSVRRTWRHPQGFSERNDLRLSFSPFLSLLRQRPDTIVSADLGPRTMQAAVYARIRPSTHLVMWARLSEHSERGRPTGRAAVRRLLLRSADAIIVNGESGATYVHRLGVPRSRIHVVHQVSALSRAAEEEVTNRHRNADETALLFVGRLVMLKGIDLLLRALATTPPKVRLRIAGDGPERSALEALASSLRLNVEFLGAVTDENQLVAEYRAADFLVHPSLSEEWGLVIAEALAQGTPVIGSNFAQAVTELIHDGENGYRFAPDNSSSLGAALSNAAATSSADWSRMSRRAWETTRDLVPGAMAAAFAEILLGP
jgi:glycosyltransferase involved in cell wall biosynthesis